MDGVKRVFLAVVLQLTLFVPVRQGNRKLWSIWWSYHGISGPDYWGLVNTQWGLCSKGRFQSPVDINPRTLLYDPNLRPLRLDTHRVDGHLMNTGNDITFQMDAAFDPPFLLAGGPLAYTYRVHRIKLHFGRVDQIGSEHTVGGRPFSMEVQLLAYNIIYDSYDEAAGHAHGLTSVAVFGVLQLQKHLPPPTEALRHDKEGRSVLSISGLSIPNLLPDTKNYMTYDGSLTQPACYETVTWIIINKPLYVSKEDLSRLRELTESKEGQQDEQYLQENNFRPTMPLSRRTVRTNIVPRSQEQSCGKKKITIFEVNDRYRVT
ncbi:carbonic anhydrase-related protein 10-like [Babylonia areolata]|uniref:carbonic anhydrase-related protein 10-like n=1 Tax=Babylonia areolata TaxID=304850 RepID=UPI003FD5C577